MRIINKEKRIKMNNYFSVNDKIYDIVKKNPKALDFLIANGFEQFKDSNIFNSMSKNISLSMALKLKKINVEIYEERLLSFLKSERESVDRDLLGTLNSKKKKADINVEGVLPCPIRIPLVESFNEWLEKNRNSFDYSIEYDLKSANMGLDWIKEQVKTGKIDEIPDILMSAGFDLFFDKELMGQFMERDVFEASIDEINKDFCNDYIDLRDPKKRYLITGVVPAVFLVNKNELNGRKIPQTWEDLLSEEFEDSVAIPMGDLDLFNALILTIYREYGEDGISKLARSYMKNLHPAEMVKSRRKNNSNTPTVSIIPYFFTKMIDENSQVAVWPKDGAIISPIFMIAKKEKKKSLQAIVDFFMSPKIGNIFSANGKFPSTNKEVDNHLEENQKFKWIGWEFIEKHDMGSLLKELEYKFNKEIIK